MQRQSKFAIVAIVVFACLAANARCQSLDAILNATDKQISKYWRRTKRREFAMPSEPKKNHESWSEYLTQNWTTLEDLKNFPGCRYMGRELGATGMRV